MLALDACDTNQTYVPFLGHYTEGMRVLVTGGAGYIGSHTVIELIEHGHEPIVVDNLCNSSAESLTRVQQLTGKPFEIHKFDVCDTERLTMLLTKRRCEVTIHFAGLKAVGESVEYPARYYRNNLDSTLSVVDAVMATSSQLQPPRIIFSSSATVYGEPQFLPLTEDHPVGQNITNPYGQTKYMCEQILADVAKAHPNFQAIALRYFNPIGAHPSGFIGEDPKQTPNNLAPFIAQVAVGRRESVGIFGDDYDTADGTGVRDYIHVMDLAAGHVAALGFTTSGFHAINLGTGTGTSVRQLISSFEKAICRAIPSELRPRRSGDIASSYASAERAHELLGWASSRKIDEACADMWAWQHSNPNGFRESDDS